VRAFGDAAGYLVRIRGLAKGRIVDETRRTTSVARALEANEDWLQLREVFADAMDIVFSNVGNSGYGIDPEDSRRPNAGEIPLSFPAKLLRCSSSATKGEPYCGASILRKRTRRRRPLFSAR
jgi:tagaturonate reductase